MRYQYPDTTAPLADSMWDEEGFIESVTATLRLTPQEIRAEVARERREATKARQLDRCTKRKHKRSQAY